MSEKEKEERQIIFKESRYLKSGHVHYYIFDSAKPDYLLSDHLDTILPELLKLGAEGFDVTKVDHTDQYTTLAYMYKKKED